MTFSYKNYLNAVNPFPCQIPFSPSGVSFLIQFFLPDDQLQVNFTKLELSKLVNHYRKLET